MIYYVLLNLLNELGKRDKMCCLPRILSRFPDELYKCIYRGARMLSMTFKLHWKQWFINVNTWCYITPRDDLKRLKHFISANINITTTYSELEKIVD